MTIRCVAGQAYTFEIYLASVANAGKFQVNPTLDTTNDFKISINGGAFASLTNAPTVTPSGGAQVQIVFAAAETAAAGAGGRINLKCADNSGGEWQDLAALVPVYANDVDTVVATATNVTTVNGLANNVITAASIAADAITAAKIADGAIDAATFAAGAINAAAIATDAITAGKIAADAIGASELAADAVTEIQSGLGTSSNQSTIISTLATIASYIDTEVAAIKAKTDNLPSDPSSASTIATSFSSIASSLATLASYVDTEVAAILAQTGTTGVVLSTATKQAIADMVNSRGMSNIDGAADKYSIYHLIMSLLNGKQAAGTWVPYTTTGTSIPGLAVPVDTDPDALPVVGTHGS